MIAVFGDLLLRGGLTQSTPIVDLEMSGELEREVQDQMGSKPATLVKGPGLETIGFVMQLRRDLGIVPEAMLERLRRMRNAGVAYPFVLGGSPVGANRWLLVGIAVSNVTLTGKGSMRSADVGLSFEEVARAGAVKPSGAASAPGVSFAISDAYRAQTPTSDEKAALKRRDVMGEQE